MADETTSTATEEKPLQSASPSDGANITAEMILKVCPDADKNAVPKFMAAAFPAMAQDKYKMITREDLISVIATVSVETTTFAPIEEYGKGGGRYVVGGKSYHGRGYFQCTWIDNYKNFGGTIGQDLVANPDLAMQPEYAAGYMCWYYCAIGPGLAGHDMRQYARKQDWHNIRSILNAGHPGKWRVCHGKEKFMGAIKRGLETFPSGIDPNAVASGSYGLGCIDTGGAALANLTGSHNPASQGSAIDYALGIMNLDSSKSHIMEGQFNPHAYPKILDLDVQKKFRVRGAGTNLDDEYTAETLIWTLRQGGSLELDLKGTKPDPNAKQPQIFRMNANASDSSAVSQAPLPAGTGDIPARIMQAAEAYRGTDTSSGPGGGNVACAWAVSHVLKNAGLQTIGSNNNSIVVAVAQIEKGLLGGRGKKIERSECVPGDIWIQPGKHIGIYTTQGGIRVLSNSSSKARFSWEDTTDNVNKWYGGARENSYRVLS